VIDPVLATLLRQLDLAFDHTSWHGPNLRGGLRSVSAEIAAWRPAPDRHSIAEQVMHAAYWKYSIRRRLRMEKRGSFPHKGSNWFPQPQPFAENDWQQCLELLVSEHRHLRQAVEGFDPSRLTARAGGGRFTLADLIHGAAAHDLYHAGQIQLLRRLQSERSAKARR
jgi:uncharacterized damage-inducible protein DinB